VMVWQHPRCFWQGLAFTPEPTGRGRCKATKAPFAAGELRLTAQAHTSTSHFNLSVAPRAVLESVSAADSALVVSAIEGYELLGEEERAKLSDGPSPGRLPAVEPTPETEAVDGEPDSTRGKAIGANDPAAELAQPKKGSISKAKGKVCWKFAGHLCYGTLLPAQETKTHCYARTHKGNTKTLAKGGSSWWML
jgi:hypothetical protein